jgi:hypothetical protein
MAHVTTCSVVMAASVLVCGSRSWLTATSADVAFQLHQHHLVVAKGSIGALNGLNLLIDTGTIPSVVDARVARKLQVQAEPSVAVAFGQKISSGSAVLDDVRVGPIQSGPLSVGVGDLSYLRDVRVDAIVGLDVLARTSFTIDYRRHTLQFGPRDREGSFVPLELVWPFLTVRMTIGRQSVRLLLDTGSRDLVLFKTRLPASLSNAPWSGDKTIQYASGTAYLRRVDLHDARLGTDRWPALTAWTLDRVPLGYPPAIDGVLGVLALDPARAAFDFERNEFGWSR